MIITFSVDKVLEPFEAHGKKFYPIATKDLRGKRGDYIFNTNVEFPKDTKIATAELYIYKGEFKVKNVMPFKTETK